MGLGTNQMTITTGTKFIPDVWMNEVRAYLEANLVVAKKCKLFPFQGRAGDTLHVPDVSALVASTKAANTQVTLQSPTENEFTLAIDQHLESSVVIEDILAVQSAYNLRQEYTRSSGYAIAKAVDNQVAGLHATLTNRALGGDGITNFTDSKLTAPTNLTEAGIRRAIQSLDVADVPDDGNRCMVIHPSQKNVLLAIARFTEYQMLGPGGMPIRTGMFGEIFGLPVYFSTNVSSSGTGWANLVMHQNALSLALQNGPRVQAQYKQEYLGWLLTVDVLFGKAIFRQNHACALYTPT